jgi:hypothetical protein
MPTTVVNLKGHRDDPAYADVVYVGRAMHRGGWHLAGSKLASPSAPVRTAPAKKSSPGTGNTCSPGRTCSPCCRSCAAAGSGAGACPSRATPRSSPSWQITARNESHPLRE